MTTDPSITGKVVLGPGNPVRTTRGFTLLYDIMKISDRQLVDLLDRNGYNDAVSRLNGGVERREVLLEYQGQLPRYNDPEAKSLQRAIDAL